MKNKYYLKKDSSETKKLIFNFYTQQKIFLNLEIIFYDFVFMANCFFYQHLDKKTNKELKIISHKIQNCDFLNEESYQNINELGKNKYKQMVFLSFFKSYILQKIKSKEVSLLNSPIENIGWLRRRINPPEEVYDYT